MYTDVHVAGELHSWTAAAVARPTFGEGVVPVTEGWLSGADITVLGCSSAVTVRLMV